MGFGFPPPANQNNNIGSRSLIRPTSPFFIASQAQDKGGHHNSTLCIVSRLDLGVLEACFQLVL